MNNNESTGSKPPKLSWMEQRGANECMKSKPGICRRNLRPTNFRSYLRVLSPRVQTRKATSQFDEKPSRASRVGTASTTPAVNTFHYCPCSYLCLRHSANARRTLVIHVSRLNAAKATKLLVSRFFPFSYQVCVRITFFQQPVIKFPRDCFTLVIQFIDVS